MKNVYTIIILLFSGLPALPQTYFDSNIYKEVLYRVNVGGIPVTSNDGTEKNWENDNYNNPSSYSNHEETGNKIFQTVDPITFHSSVPEGISPSIFQVERSIEEWSVERMTWQFEVEPEKVVDVRIYMAEIFFNDPGARSFGIEIEGQLVEESLDLASEYGHDVGVVKTYEVVSDGIINIDFIQGRGQPTIGGIEILEKQTIAAGTITHKLSESNLIFPNPVNDVLHINTKVNGDVAIFDLTGNKVETISSNGTENGMTVNCHKLNKGIYILTFNNKSFKLTKY